MPRVDVEGSLLCDVLPDGTIAGQALVEAVYDTSSGDRLGTRTVNPATGADYAVQGTLQPCPPPDQCTCETLLLCDVPPGGELPTSAAAITVTAATPGENGVPGIIYGGPINAPLPTSQAVWDGAAGVLSASVDNGHTYIVGALDLLADCGDLDPAGSTTLNLGLRITNDGAGAPCGLWGRFTVWANGVDVIGAPGDLGTLGGGTGLAPGASTSPTRTAVVTNADLLAGLVYVELNVQTGADTTPDGGGCLPNDPGVGQALTVDQFTVTAEPVAVTGCLAPGDGDPVPFLRHICRTCTGTATVTNTTLDGTTTYDVQGVVGVCGPTSDTTGGRQVVERCGCDQTASGVVRYIELWSVDTADPEEEPLLLGTWQDGDFTQPYEPTNPVDCPAGAPEEVAAPIVLGQICYDDGTSIRAAAVVRCAGCDDITVRYVDVETGAELTAPAVVPCPADPGCASPTTPVTSVGLCLADGTPIAVTITRDCTGTTVSEGWLNLVTGAWNAGAVPVGTVACGDSRSIQVSGTFCAIDDATGDVVRLLLVEYTYDDTGAIADVRLLDATTGVQYEPPTGVTVTTCPTGTEQPEQDAVVLCHTATDGTVTQFVRDYRRDEVGAIVGHTDYLLDGTAFDASTGTVGVCPPADDCEVVPLCDVQPDVAAVLPSFGTPSRVWQTLPNGVRWMKRGNDFALPAGWFNADGGAVERFDFDRPVSIRYTVRFSGPTAAPLRIPAGWYLDGLNVTQHTWNAATRTISPTASATQAGESTFRLEAQTAQTMTAPAPVGTQAAGQNSQYGQITVTADLVTPFLRTLCRDAAGTVTKTDTTLDGVTVYAVVGTEGTCPEIVPPSCRDCETLLLCDEGANEPATITGLASSGTLSNGVTWTATSPTGGQAMSSVKTNSDGAWWGLHIFPLPNVAPTKWTFSQPSVVEFSVFIPTATAPINTAQLPAGLEVVNLPDGYTYDAATGVLTRTVDLPADPCTYVTEPQIETSPRFRTPGAVTSYTTAPAPNSRIARCGIFLDYWSGAIEVTPVGQFLRHICRDCDGSVSSVADTTLDGSTPYAVLGAAVQCAATSGADTEACPNTTTVILCDAGPGEEPAVQTYEATAVDDPDAVARITATLPVGRIDGTVDPAAFFAGTGTAVYAATPPQSAEAGKILGGRIVPATTSLCGDPAEVTITVIVPITNDGPNNGDAIDSFGRVFNGETQLNLTDVSGAVVAQSQGGATGVGITRRHLGTVTVPAADYLAGLISFGVYAETAQNGGTKQWTASGFELSVESATPVVCAVEGEPHQFLRTLSRDCATGEVTVTDTELDGVTVYDVHGAVSMCGASSGEEECCPPVVTELLCDTAGGDVQSYPPSTVAVVPPVEDASSIGISSTVAGFMINPTPLFAPGGSVVVPTWGTNPGGVRYNAIEGQVSSPGPTPCGTPTDVVITVSLRGTNTGDGTNLADPEAGMTLRNGSTVLDTQFVNNTPTGVQQAYSLTATVPWADLIAGNITWYWFAKVYQANNVHKQFTLDQYEVTIEDAIPLPGCAEVTPFLRHYTVDATGQTVTHFDTLLDGTAYAANAPAVCAGEAVPGSTAAHDVETWPLCVLNLDGSVLQHVRAEQTYDETGAALGEPRIVDAVTGGPVALPGGATIGVCPGSSAEECTTVHVVPLCDTVTPLAVIPTPGSAFTLTGSVSVDANENLVYSNGEQPPNGVAALVVPGLLAGASYNVEFEAAFQGLGVPTGVPQAIYLVEVLDGATVLASRETNVNVEPIGPQPPLTFTAPASGEVTLRFTDHTTDNGATRDLIITPRQIVTTAELSPIVTPFLRLLTVDCDGQVTGSTDVALDGTTTYDVQGEEGICASSSTGPGTTASGRQLVERCGCSDEDGDGTGEVRYVELWSVDPDGEGAPLLVGTYIDGDFDQPFVPAAPVDCPAGDDDGTAAPVLTGARSITGTAPVDLAAEFPGLQSVTLLASSGSVLATLTDGAAVPIPAGANVTWSVTRDQDTALAAAAFAGADAGTAYLLLWTYVA
ncbi:hypothetical protein ABTX34_29005 [Streptomyces sp. NPDC096538]|uniref:hypothetical protein n=1 Tax=Streptomyces sp. NPDC096538 TaxID=3155427 RepID=UPI0033188C89